MNKERNCQARQCDYHGRNEYKANRVQGFWLKKLTFLHDRIAQQLDDVLNGRKVIAEWMTLGQKNVVFKDPGNGVDNYRPIYHVYPLCGICRQAGWFRKARTTP